MLLTAAQSSCPLFNVDVTVSSLRSFRLETPACHVNVLIVCTITQVRRTQFYDHPKSQAKLVIKERVGVGGGGWGDWPGAHLHGVVTGKVSLRVTRGVVSPQEALSSGSTAFYSRVHVLVIICNVSKTHLPCILAYLPSEPS